ncbi:MAG: CHC2 zinc finger domain-containing protein, partial [Deltaproteobacteria bacterium]
MKQQILNHFNGNYSTFYKKYLQKVKSIGKSEYQALCPFHDDTNRSLSFNSRNGQYYCHGCPNNGNFFRFYAELKGLDIKRDFRKVLNGVADDFGITRTQEKSRVVKHYVYRDITGEPLHRTVRTEPKGFYQQRYENGKW